MKMEILYPGTPTRRFKASLNVLVWPSSGIVIKAIGNIKTTC